MVRQQPSYVNARPLEDYIDMVCPDCGHAYPLGKDADLTAIGIGWASCQRKECRRAAIEERKGRPLR